MRLSDTGGFPLDVAWVSGIGLGWVTGDGSFGILRIPAGLSLGRRIVTDDGKWGMCYRVKSQTHFAIGFRYTIPINEKQSALLHEAERGERWHEEEVISAWSVHDSSARRAKSDQVARDRLIRE